MSIRLDLHLSFRAPLNLCLSEAELRLRDVADLMVPEKLDKPRSKELQVLSVPSF